MRVIARAVSLLIVLSAPAVAQLPSMESRPYSFSIAGGPSRAFRGVDAAGGEAQGGIAYRLGGNFGVRLEGTGHWYQDQPLYPCIVQDADRCYQTMRRSVTAGTLSATYHVSRFASNNGRHVPYVIAGLGVYRSQRIATSYPSCAPPNDCADRSVHELEMRDTQLGLSGGLGADFSLGPVAIFSELRLHYIYSDAAAGRPGNDYFLWPLSVGLRF